MGPILSDTEISQIDDMVVKKLRYRNIFLKDIKSLYDESINNNPDPSKLINLKKKYPSYDHNNIIELYNRQNVDKLKMIRF